MGKKLHSNLIYPAILILASLLLFFLDQNNYLNFLRSFTEIRLNPIKKSLYQKTNKSQNPFLSDSDFINQLEAKNLSVKLLNKKIKELEQENKILQEQLNAPFSSDTSYLPANILGINRYLVIDKGKIDGVKKNQAVVFSDILIGKIIEVSAKTAKVILPTDPKSKIPAIDQISGARGLVAGQYQTSLIFEKILTSQKLAKDNLVVTSGQDKILPPNLIIGEITKIAKKETKVFQTAQLELLIDYNKLLKVFVILN